MPIPIIDRRNDGDKKSGDDIEFSWEPAAWTNDIAGLNGDTLRALAREMALRVDQSMRMSRTQMPPLTRTDGGRSLGVEGTMMSFTLPRPRIALSPELQADAVVNYDPFASAPMPAPQQTRYYTNHGAFVADCQAQGYIIRGSSEYPVVHGVPRVDAYEAAYRTFMAEAPINFPHLILISPVEAAGGGNTTHIRVTMAASPHTPVVPYYYPPASDADIPRCGYFTDFNTFEVAALRRRWVPLYSARYEIVSPLVNIDHIRLRAYELFCQQLRTETNDPVIVLVRIRDVHDYSDAYPIGHQVIEVHAAGLRKDQPPRPNFVADDRVQRW